MPNVNTSFQGTTLIIPGAYYADNVQPASPATPPTTPPLIFLGNAWGQQPQVPVTYTSAAELLDAIRGGPCSGFVPFLTSPSPVLNGAQQITLINVSENTRSGLLLSAGVTGVVNLTSVNYGLPSNQLQAMVQTGTLAGKKVTIYDGYANQQTIGDNLGVPFKLAYTGSATGVTYTVTASGANNAVTFATSSPTAGESVSINLLPGVYDTVEKVVNYLNGTGYYSATQLSPNSQMPSSNLDACANQPLASGATLQYVNIAATLGDIVYWVNHLASAYASAALVSGVTSVSGLAPTNIPLTLFSGATSVPPTLADYASGFNVALGIPGWTVFADSNASGVQALGTQHALTASQTQNGRWRRFYTGSSVGDSVSSAVSGAQAQGSLRTVYAYPGIYRVDTATGLNTLYGGLYAAAAAAGMNTGNPIPTPLTNKALAGTGVETKLTVSQINTLQSAGVMPIYIPSLTGQPTICSDLTTWQADNNPENTFIQQVSCRDFLGYVLVAATQPYVGTVADRLDETRILNSVKAALNANTYSATNTNGVISTWDPTSLTLVYTGSNQTAAVSVNVALVGQNRFITIFVPIQPLNITITVAAQAGGSVS